MKKLVVLLFFALGSIYFVACNRDSMNPDSMSVDAVSAANADSTKKHKPQGDELGNKGPKGMPHGDSLGHKPPQDSPKPPKLDSLGHKPKKGPKHG